MFKFFLNTFVTLAVVFCFYEFVPASWLELPKFGEHTTGSTITTINGSDTIASSRSVINTNFSNLNSTKAETTATTLANLVSIGTITTGVWNATPVTVPYGGTGSTTLSSNQLLLGNGTGIVKNVSGWGTSGQLLTSGGLGVAPTWGSPTVDTAIDYTWTGKHTFSATTSQACSNALSVACIFNSIPYAFPTTRGASSTVLTENGSGALIWQQPQYQTICTSVVSASSNSNSTTTATGGYCSIPANTINASNRMLIITSQWAEINGNNVCYMEQRFGNGVASTTFASLSIDGSTAGFPLLVETKGFATSTTAMGFSTLLLPPGTGNLALGTAQTEGAYASSTALTSITGVDFRYRSGGTNTCQLIGFNVAATSH